MLFMVINRTRTDLSGEDFAELGRLAQTFYENVPAGLSLHGDWGATDGSRTFALIEAESQELLEQVQAPFRRFVDMELVPVNALEGWSR